jgi:hypothetical protein
MIKDMGGGEDATYYADQTAQPLECVLTRHSFLSGSQLHGHSTHIRQRDHMVGLEDVTTGVCFGSLKKFGRRSLGRFHSNSGQAFHRIIQRS